MICFYVILRVMKWEHQHFETVISTNDTAVGLSPFTLVTADTQTGGRGRYGRQWISDRGNLFFSAVLPLDTQSADFMPFAAGLAVVKALHPLPVQLKWPNDVLLNGRKIAGILLERTDNTLIIGIGINLVTAPATGTLYPAGHLSGAFSPTYLIERLADNLYQYSQTDWNTIRTKWLQQAVGLGQTITVRLAHETITGTFIDLSPAGALILQQGTATKHIVAGDIFLEKDKK